MTAASILRPPQSVRPEPLGAVGVFSSSITIPISLTSSATVIRHATPTLPFVVPSDTFGLVTRIFQKWFAISHAPPTVTLDYRRPPASRPRCFSQTPAQRRQLDHRAVWGSQIWKLGVADYRQLPEAGQDRPGSPCQFRLGFPRAPSVTPPSGPVDLFTRPYRSVDQDLPSPANRWPVLVTNR